MAQPSSAPRTYVLKTEPEEFSFSDLVAAGRTPWNGVTNPAALNHLRGVRPGDEAFIYHTGTERAIVGLARFVSAAYADPQRPELNARGEPKFVVADVEAVGPAREPVTLDQVKAAPGLAETPGFDLVRLPRLSVMPVPTEVAARLRAWAGFA